MGHTGNDEGLGLERDEETADLARDERRETRRSGSWWHRRRVKPEDREQILGRLFFEAESRKPYWYRFALLQGLASVIAVLGVLSNSPAIVIGAMLLAPLMTPVLALAAALAMAWPRRAAKAGLMVVAATAGSVLVAWLVAVVIPSAQVGELPAELLSRTHPSLLDLLVALAAGVAGGYSLVREEVGSSLPGVAVAVALVPPLAVVGASLHLGEGDLALGAALLYLVNLTAIVLASGVVFLVTGFIPAVRITRLSGRVASTIALVVVLVGVLAVPLTRGLQDAIRDDRAETAALDEVEAWLGEQQLEVVSLVVKGDSITVDLIGEGPPPPTSDLSSRLEARLGRPMSATVRWVERHVDSNAPPSGFIDPGR
ncbi:MAG TPA: hypothetical protein DCY40_06190 [Actinobacteria bacterium]|nr:hypothetical protein [Actinomycetota bacterium]